MQTTKGQRAAELLASAGPTMSVKDSSHVLGCHPTTLYEMIKRGDLERMGVRVLPLGRSLRLVTEDMRRMLGAEAPGNRGVA